VFPTRPMKPLSTKRLLEIERVHNEMLNAKVLNIRRQRNIAVDALKEIKLTIEDQAPDDVHPDEWSWGCWSAADNALKQIEEKQ
jgi:hypothetical protein